MIPYFSVFILLSLASIVDIVGIEKKQRILFYIISGCILVIFAGIRGENFPDYLSYRQFFQEINMGIESGIVSADYGFIIINKVVGLFTDSSIVLFFFLAVLAVGINIKCYKDYSRYPGIVILLYFVHTYLGREMVQIRSGLAAAIILYSYRFLINGNWKKYLFYVWVASTIHLAALSVLVMWPLYKKLSNYKWLYVWIIGCALVGLFYPFGNLLRTLPEMDELYRLQTYTGSEFDNKLGIIQNPVVIKGLCVSIIGLIYYNKLESKIYGYKIFLLSNVFSVCWLMVWNDFAIVAARIATFFSISEGLLLAAYICLFKQNSRAICACVLLIISFFILYLNLITGKVPEYQTIFQ